MIACQVGQVIDILNGWRKKRALVYVILITASRFRRSAFFAEIADVSPAGEVLLIGPERAFPFDFSHDRTVRSFGVPSEAPPRLREALDKTVNSVLDFDIGDGDRILLYELKVSSNFERKEHGPDRLGA